MSGQIRGVRGHRLRRVVALGTASIATALVSAALVAAPVATSSALAQAATSDDPFTFVVIPDTQKYVQGNQELAATFTAQARWIRDSRANLNTAFVSHLGDMVESHPSDPQWKAVDAGFRLLDDANVPYSVAPGNHDMNVNTGEAPKFDQYFGPQRFTRATWTPSTTRYGGYMGQNQFGTTDPVNRGNKNNYSLFTAGGQNYLVLSLEHEVPDSAIAWAQKIVRNYPNRRVIMTTHTFIDQNGRQNSWTSRTDQETNGGPQIWDKLVSNNCNIFLVVNGHWANGADGEGRRVDNNDCGRPVQQISTDYQGRPGGGEGWLRYYTFNPATNSVTAKTYSPTLKRYETDADSQFSFVHEMSDSATTTSLMDRGEYWRRWFKSPPPPSDWTARGFNASSWIKQRAPLGFGSTWQPTSNIDVPAGTRRPVTAQFRHWVDVVDPAALSNVKLKVFADDGFTAYVNGREVGRYNVGSGTVTSSTYATSTRRSPEAQSQGITLSVPAWYLKEGANTVAIQVSSYYRATADMSMDASMTASIAR